MVQPTHSFIDLVCPQAWVNKVDSDSGNDKKSKCKSSGYSFLVIYIIYMKYEKTVNLCSNMFCSVSRAAIMFLC